MIKAIQRDTCKTSCMGGAASSLPAICRCTGNEDVAPPGFCKCLLKLCDIQSPALIPEILPHRVRDILV